ncbi:hypothetical protein BHE74_00036971 [Ensete ventricosum]|nr:hypothetical protein BHE74_00036971 [Ensete ventricosum]
MSMRAGVAADAAAALLFRILSQPTLLFPPLRHAEGVEVHHEPLVPASEASIEATAQGIATMLCAHGPDVEWRMCTIWEAAYGLLSLSSSSVDLPEIVIAAPLQPPPLSWNLYLPLLKVLEYLPRGSPSEACLIRLFVATVEAILRRTFPSESSTKQKRKSRLHGSMWSATKNLAIAELHTMIHSLFLESCATMDLASRLLFVVLTVCVSHEALPNGSKRSTDHGSYSADEFTEEPQVVNGRAANRNKNRKKQGPVSTFDSYVLAAVCALACELQLFPIISKNGIHSDSKNSAKSIKASKTNGIAYELHSTIRSAVCHTRRILGILEALFSLKPSSIGTSWSYGSNEIVAAAMVAAHVSELFGRSKACMNALSIMMRCKWDREISTRASSLYNLIDKHGKIVASIVHKAEPFEAQLVRAQVRKDDPTCSSGRVSISTGSSNFLPEDIPCSESNCSSSGTFVKAGKGILSTDTIIETSGKKFSSLPVDASDLANFLMTDWLETEALIILASASDLLLRATDGMLVDGEVCTLPQLEQLLEVTAKAVQLVIHWGEPGVAVADGLANLLKVAPPPLSQQAKNNSNSMTA